MIAGPPVVTMNSSMKYQRPTSASRTWRFISSQFSRWNRSSTSRSRVNVLMSMSPLMPRLSAISELTEALRCCRSVRKRRRSFPTVNVGTISHGSTIRETIVSRQSRAIIVTRVVVRISAFCEMVTRVPEMMVSMPAMSLVSRDMSSPVRASV